MFNDKFVLMLRSAVLGESIEVPTIGGKVKIKVEPGTQSGKVLRLRGKGLPSVQGYATGDQFVHSTEMVHKINQVYDDIYAIEMEAGAIAHVSTIYNVPFIVYRSISDILGEKAQDMSFDKFVEESKDVEKVTNGIFYKLIMKLLKFSIFIKVLFKGFDTLFLFKEEIISQPMYFFSLT